MTARPSARARCLLVAIVLAASVGCRRADDGRIGDVVMVQATVERGSGGAWTPATIGTALMSEDFLRTGPGAKAEVRLGGGRLVRVGPNGLVRFARGPVPATASIALELGEAMVDGEGQVFFSTPKGLASLGGSGRLRMKAGERTRQFEVVVGEAEMEGLGPVRAGQGVSFEIGKAEIVRYDIQVGVAVLETLPDAADAGAFEARAADAVGPSSADAESGAVATAQPTEAAPARRVTDDSRAADLTLPGGESATIHYKHAPVGVRIGFAPVCPRGAAVELVGRRGSRSQGRTSAVLIVPAGRHGYRVVCLGADGTAERRVKASGRIAVFRDAGTAPVVKTAPRNVIDADGRKYTVLYQTRLPALVFTWPNAPAGPYELHVESDGKARTFSSNEPRLLLGSGKVAEGLHSWWFTTTTGAMISRTTSLKVDFDNSGATAQIRTPADGFAPVESGVEVSGVARDGWAVSVGGQPLTVDSRGRFKGHAAVPAGPDRALAVRVEHPRGGVHYYLRRTTRAK